MVFCLLCRRTTDPVFVVPGTLPTEPPERMKTNMTITVVYKYYNLVIWHAEKQPTRVASLTYWREHCLKYSTATGSSNDSSGRI